jgi:hypothetical protein
MDASLIINRNGQQQVLKKQIAFLLFKSNYALSNFDLIRLN